MGAVALDGEGHLAAATSTGGTTGQLVALVRLAGLSLGAACHRALHEVQYRAGTGGTEPNSACDG